MEKPKKEYIDLKTLEENTAIWYSRKDPPSDVTMKIGGKGLTAVDGAWMCFAMTEIFGPCGIGWGYEVSELTRYREETTSTSMMSVRIELWYKHKGEVGRITSYGQKSETESFKNGKTIYDEECYKKAITDGLKKCISYLGIASKVYMGKFDTDKYIKAMEEEVDKAALEEEVKDEILRINDIQELREKFIAVKEMSLPKESIDKLTDLMQKRSKDILGSDVEKSPPQKNQEDGIGQTLKRSLENLENNFKKG